MDKKRTFGNLVMIRLDRENNFIKLKSGGELYIDTSFDGEKHSTVIGEVYGLPSKLRYSGKPNNGMPWKTNLEVEIGDTVIVYYLAIVNCFRPESYKAIIEGADRYVFINYQNIYAIVRNGKIIPVNGYCLIEPIEDPAWTNTKKRLVAAGLVPLDMDKKSNKDVVYGKVKYYGTPNEEYVDSGYSDNSISLKTNDIVVLKRVSDIPMEYDLHAKIDGGRKYWRIHRRQILAIYEF